MKRSYIVFLSIMSISFSLNKDVYSLGVSKEQVKKDCKDLISGFCFPVTVPYNLVAHTKNPVDENECTTRSKILKTVGGAALIVGGIMLYKSNKMHFLNPLLLVQYLKNFKKQSPQ